MFTENEDEIEDITEKEPFEGIPYDQVLVVNSLFRCENSEIAFQITGTKFDILEFLDELSTTETEIDEDVIIEKMKEHSITF